MMWLDDYTFRLGSLYREEEVDAGADIQDVMQNVMELLLERIRDDPTPKSLGSHGPDADLYVFYSRFHTYLRQGLRVEASLADKLRSHVPSMEEIGLYLHHVFRERRFVYVDFSDGGLRFGGDVEVKAVVVKSGHMYKPMMPGLLPGCTERFGPLLDVVVGRPGVPSRNRITFCTNDHNLLEEVVMEEGSAYPTNPSPRKLLAEVGRSLIHISEEIQMTVINAILHAKRYEGTRFAKRIPRLRQGDPWRKRNIPHPRKTLFENIVNLSGDAS